MKFSVADISSHKQNYINSINSNFIKDAVVNNDNCIIDVTGSPFNIYSDILYDYRNNGWSVRAQALDDNVQCTFTGVDATVPPTGTLMSYRAFKAIPTLLPDQAFFNALVSNINTSTELSVFLSMGVNAFMPNTALVADYTPSEIDLITRARMYSFSCTNKAIHASPSD